MDQEEVRRRQVQVQRDLLHSQGSQATRGISGISQEAPRRNPQATKPEVTEAQPWLIRSQEKSSAAASSSKSVSGRPPPTLRALSSTIRRRSNSFPTRPARNSAGPSSALAAFPWQCQPESFGEGRRRLDRFDRPAAAKP